jgi:RND family efflux transporter MFP subunit
MSRFAMSPRVLIVIVSAMAAASCARHEAAPVAMQTEVPSAPVVKATLDNLSGSITLTGEFVPYQDVDVMAKVAGYIRSIGVDVGDRVKQGQVLATLEIPEMEDDLTRAAAAIDQANAEAARAREDVRRAESAHEMTQLSRSRIENVAKREPGLVPQQEVDEIRSRDLEAEAQVAGAKSNLLAAQNRISVLRSDEARLRTMRKYETITAPFDGVVTKRYASTGAMIQAGTASQSQAMPVVRVSQNNLLRLVLPVPESSVSEVAIGKNVSVRVPSLHRTFSGRVARFTDTLALSTRTMDTEVEVPNPSLTLIPGMYAEVDLQLQERKNVVAVPLDAIDGSGPDARVFEVAQGGLIHIVPVKVGLQTAGEAEIQTGISEGDTVIVGRHAGLKEGDAVKPVTAAFASKERGK